MKDYDVVVAGGGPAGSVLALKTAPSLKVLVLEYRHLLTPSRIYEREKCCGGMLDHAAQKELAHLGIPLPKKVLAGPQIFTVRAIDFDNHMERYFQRNYLNIDRALFDSFLLRMAASRDSVTVVDGAAICFVSEEGNGARVVYRDKNGQAHTVTCRYLVGADGAMSQVRNLLRPQAGPLYRKPRVYASIEEWHDAVRPLAYYAAIFDRRVTDFYSWIIPKGKQIIIGSAIPAESARLSREGKGFSVQEKFEIFRGDLIQKGFEVSHPVKRRGAAILRPYACGSVFSGHGPLFLCGEAAGLISPSSSEGISFAMRSGEALARSFAAKDPRTAYERELSPLRALIAAKCVKSPIMYDPVPRGMVFCTRADSMKVLKDTERWS